MADESGQAENLPDAEEPTATERITELESLLTQKDEEITSLKQTGQEMEKKLAALGGSLLEAVTSYKAAVVRANPEVIEGLISGDTIESINESLAKAKELVSRVRQEIENGITLAKVPAGAPARTPADLSALSPREKIQYAIGRK